MSQQLGTLLEVSGRPKQIVEIVRLGSKQARIRESYYMPGDAKYVETKVPRDRVIEDGGEAYRRQGKSKCAMYLDLMGEPSAMVKVVRAYKRKSVVRFFEGHGHGELSAERRAGEFVPFGHYYRHCKAWPASKYPTEGIFMAAR